MSDTYDAQISIHLRLRKLIEEKAKRDNIKFTACQLAQTLNIPRSIITKLTHQDKNKRVTNPRIDTLLKIIDFFKADGFDISLEDLLGLKSNFISIKNQLPIQTHHLMIPVYALDDIKQQLGHVDIKISQQHHNVIGLYAQKDIKPFFKSGSIFVLDPNGKLEDNILVVIQNAGEILIKKYRLRNNKVTLASLDEQEPSIVLMPTTSIKIIGVIVQVNANT